jgi:hypothetical protein
MGAKLLTLKTLPPCEVAVVGNMIGRKDNHSLAHIPPWPKAALPALQGNSVDDSWKWCSSRVDVSGGKFTLRSIRFKVVATPVENWERHLQVTTKHSCKFYYIANGPSKH